MFAAWGRLIYRRRWVVLALSVVPVALSVAGLLGGGTLSNGNSTSSSLEAARASRLMGEQLNTGEPHGSSFLLILGARDIAVSDPRFEAAVSTALAPIEHDSRVVAVQTPYAAATPEMKRALTSKDGHEVLVRIDINSTGHQARDDFAALRGEVTSPILTVTATGGSPINEAFNTTLENDLQRAELVSGPVSLVLLLVIFGTLVAALLPVGIGILSILGGVAATLMLTHVTDVSQYALNIVTLVGLGVSIDYSLIVVNRFRDELASGATREEALAVTMATAGRAITFSGLTVGVGLSAMLFYRGTFLASMGAAGGVVVAVAVFYGLTLLPALLAVLGPGVDRLALPLAGRRRVHGLGLWHRLATWVMRRPLTVLLPAVGVLVLMGTPFLHLRLANGGPDELPKSSEARRGFDDLIANFPGQDQTVFDVVINYPSGDASTAARAADQASLTGRYTAIPGVLRVSRSAAPNIAVLTVVSNAPVPSDSARTILAALRAQSVPGAELLVTGETAYDVDIINYIVAQTPIAVTSVLLITYVVLFLMTGSVILPLKAVVLNLLSVLASFGALVWVFQDGHFSTVLGFTPQSIDPSIPVIMFAIVFGMSMDYEVLLVSRIREEYLRSGDNTKSVADGLERSGRLITGAAAIMVAVFLAFGLADVVLIKSIGLGLALAVALDATIVRALIVPAMMRLLGDNWWAPAPLRKLHSKLGFSATSP